MEVQGTFNPIAMSTTFLRKLSIGYLLLPNLAFFGGWFRQPYSTFLIVGYLLLMIREIRKPKSAADFSLSDIMFLLLFAIIWTIFSGVNGIVAQTADFHAHNAKFFDLYNNDWPNYFAEIDRYSCYYFGYFLIPALVSKLAGTFIPSTLFLWSAIGYFIGASWVYYLVHKSRNLLFAFLWFKGVGHIIFYTLKKSLFIVAPFYLPMIRATFEQSQWVPNQLIPTLIVTCIFLYDAFHRQEPQDSFLPLTLLLIWGIFPALSLFLIFSVICFKKYIIQQSLSELFSSDSLLKYWIPFILIWPTLIYFLSSNGSQTGVLWKYDNFYKISFFYLIGFFIDWLLYFLLIKYTQKKSPWLDTWFINTLFILFLLASFLRIGKNNDWFLRGQIPFFLIVVITLLRHFSISEFTFILGSKKIQATFAIAALTAFVQFGFSCYLLRDNMLIGKFFPTVTRYVPIEYDQFPNVYQALKSLHPKDADAEQYLGKKGSFYEKHLARVPGQ